MGKKMKAAVMTEVGRIDYMEKDIPVPKDNEVLVKVKHVGLCGSDIHYYRHGRIGDFVVEGPIILGHESSGEVVEAGRDVKGLKEGDLVSMEPGIPCGKCGFCKSGKYNLCPDVVFMATPPYDGAFVEYVAYPEEMAFKLPGNMDTVEGALIEPLAVGFHAAKQAKAGIGKNAVILGAGCIGLVTMMTLKAMGIPEVYMTDMVPKRLQKAIELGAAGAFKADETDVAAKIEELTGCSGVDMVFETAGSKAATQQTVELVKRGGIIVLVGMAPEALVPYDLGKLISKEAGINTVFRYRNLYPDAIRAVADGLIPLKEIITHTYPFSEVEKAIECSINNKDDVVKAIIEI